MDFKRYSQDLAYKMADCGLTKVKYEIYGYKFRNNSEWDEFFKPTDNPMDRIIRNGAP